MDGRHESADLATPAIVFQPLGEGLGLAEMLKHLPAFTELAQHRPQLEANLEGLLQRGLGSPAMTLRISSACSNQVRASESADRAAAFPPACRR